MLPKTQPLLKRVYAALKTPPGHTEPGAKQSDHDADDPKNPPKPKAPKKDRYKY